MNTYRVVITQYAKSQLREYLAYILRKFKNNQSGECYLKHPAGNILTVEEALRIYEEMEKSIEQCKLEDKMDFWNDCLKKAAKYTKIRNDWEIMSREEKMDTDSSRTSAHDSVITAVNILSRIAEQEGVDNSWRKELGDNRKRVGDFACFIAYITGISNR